MNQDLTFDVVISLGFNCNTRYQISRILYKRQFQESDGFFVGVRERNGVEFRDFGAFFFDWLITSFDSLFYILESDFSDVFLRENLEIIETHDWPALKDRKTGVEYLHFLPWEEHDTLNECVLNERYFNEKLKVDYLINKTRNLLDGKYKVLFVYFGLASSSSIIKLLKILDGRVDDYHVLYLAFTDNTIKFEKLRSYCTYVKVMLLKLISNRFFNFLSVNLAKLTIKPVSYTGYPGDERVWDNAFKNIRISGKFR